MSDTRDIFPRILARVSRVSGDFPVQHATRLLDWSAAVYSARLSVCRVVLQILRVQHARLVADILARMSRGCYEETASVKIKLMYFRVFCTRNLLSNSTTPICCGFALHLAVEQIREKPSKLWSLSESRIYSSIYRTLYCSVTRTAARVLLLYFPGIQVTGNLC